MKLPVANIASAGRQRGVTLVELLISLALSLAVLVGLSAVYVAAKQSFRFQETGGRMQEDAMFAMETISRELRMAGFGGCMGVQMVDAVGTVPDYPLNSLDSASWVGITGPNPLAVLEPANLLVTKRPLSPYNFVRGFDVNIPAAMFATAPVSTEADSLFFAGASSRAASVSPQFGPLNLANPLAIVADSASFLDSTKIYTLVVSDCKTSSLFAGKVESNTTIAHDAAKGNASGSFPAPGFAADAIVMPLEWSFYYVAIRPGAATPSLYRVFYDGNSRQPAEELISNVESMRIFYGEDTIADDKFQADVWRTTAAAVLDWSKVVAVRIGLMMVSEDNAANLDVASAAPTLLGEPYDLTVAGRSPTRLRKEFSTTVVLRNRILPR